jgi:hypothetical protein
LPLIRRARRSLGSGRTNSRYRRSTSASDFTERRDLGFKHQVIHDQLEIASRAALKKPKTASFN